MVAMINSAVAQAISVDQLEGMSHGFLTLSDLNGKHLADGEMTQTANSETVTSHLVFRFQDGSLYDDTTVYTQKGEFHLVNDHTVQRGPAFKEPMDTTIDTRAGSIKVRTIKDGQEKIIQEQFDIPPSTANGLLLTLLNHLQGRSATVDYVAITPKPRLVKLEISKMGEDRVRRGSINATLVNYVVKIHIPGIAGLLAPLVGKQPRDMKVSVIGGPVPSFVRFEGPLYAQGPVWRIEVTTPPALPGRFAPPKNQEQHAGAISSFCWSHAAWLTFAIAWKPSQPPSVGCRKETIVGFNRAAEQRTRLDEDCHAAEPRNVRC
jgi:hypothetical protein